MDFDAIKKAKDLKHNYLFKLNLLILLTATYKTNWL